MQTVQDIVGYEWRNHLRHVRLRLVVSARNGLNAFLKREVGDAVELRTAAGGSFHLQSAATPEGCVPGGRHVTKKSIVLCTAPMATRTAWASLFQAETTDARVARLREVHHRGMRQPRPSQNSSALRCIIDLRGEHLCGDIGWSRGRANARARHEPRVLGTAPGGGTCRTNRLPWWAHLLGYMYHNLSELCTIM